MSRAAAALPSLRVPLLRDYSAAAGTEPLTLREAGLEPAGTREREHSTLTRWKASDPALQATLTIEQLASNAELACAYFAGADRADLATKLVPVLSYLPVELLHLMGRASPVREERQAALQVMGQFYSAEEGISYGDADLSETIDIAWQDPDPEVRLDAAAAEISCDPARAKVRVEKELEEGTDVDLRDALATLYRLTELDKVQAGPAGPPPGAPRAGGTPFVIPMHRPGSISDLVQGFSGSTTLTARRDVDSGGVAVASIAELRPVRYDATITFVTTEWDVACSCFGGPDRVVVAVGSGHVLKYFPLHLAKIAAIQCGDAELRTRALRALTFASSARMFPGLETDPEVARIIRRAAKDPDLQVRSAAISSMVLLRAELGLTDTGAGMEELPKPPP